jgi:hypothetical protein
MHSANCSAPPRCSAHRRRCPDFLANAGDLVCPSGAANRRRNRHSRQTELVIQKFATKPAKPDDEPKHERATILLEAARYLALGQDARIARARSFADTANAFLRAWPACGAHLRRTITFLSFRLPPREAAELRLTRRPRPRATDERTID